MYIPSLSDYLAELAVENLEISIANNEITQQHETISDALINSVHLDNIQNVIHTSKEFSRFSMHATNLAIESICQNLGAPIDKYINTFSLENLTSDSYKQIAFEDVQMFIKDLWIKIKESVNRLWEKVTEFWHNNFSTLNKVKAALDAALIQVNEQYKRNTVEEAANPDINLLSNFNNGKDVNQKTIDGFITAHHNALNTIDELIQNTRYFNRFTKYLTQSNFENETEDILKSIKKNFINRTYRLGSEQAPIITGSFITIEYTQPENTFDIKFTSNVQKVDSKNDAKLFMLDKDKLRNVINKTTSVIREILKYRDIQNDLQKEFNKLISTYDKHIENQGFLIDFDNLQQSNTNLLNNYKRTIRTIYHVNISMPKVLGTFIISNIKLARSVVQYTHFCLTH